MGYEIGYEIASEADNFIEAFNSFSAQHDDFVSADKQTEAELIAHVASEAGTTESEHYRQFSPFEQTAHDFNESRDPDGIWEAYESGVYKGAVAGAKDALKKLTRKAIVLD